VALVPGRMGVQVGQVSRAERHQVALRAQVVLDRDRKAVAGDVEGECGRLTGASDARRDMDTSVSVDTGQGYFELKR
jgi:hypothetical protein